MDINKPAKPIVLHQKFLNDPYFYLSSVLTVSFILLLYIAVIGVYKNIVNKNNPMFFLFSSVVFVILMIVYNPLFFNLKIFDSSTIFWTIIHFIGVIYSLVFLFTVLNEN